MTGLPTFDMAAFTGAVDVARREQGLSWFELADDLWAQSAALNADLGDDAICGGAVSRLGRRDATSCQYALTLLRWLGRAPEEFLTGPTVDVGEVALPEGGPEVRLRWDLPSLHTALATERERRGLTWAALAAEIGCTPGRLTNLRTARQADMDLTVRVTQWLGRPGRDFVHPARW